MEVEVSGKKNIELILSKQVEDSYNIKKSLLKEIKKIQLFEKKIFNTIKNKKKILICGNGGSAADAQHLSAEFLV